MLPHRIHLKGPWEYEWLTPAPSSLLDETGRAGKSVPPRGKLRMPASWQSVFGRRAGVVVFRRRFHRPTNLDRHERVFLVLDGVGGAALVTLNEQAIGTISPPGHRAEYDISNQLEETNFLLVEVRFDGETAGEIPGGLWGPVALEIRRGQVAAGPDS